MIPASGSLYETAWANESSSLRKYLEREKNLWVVTNALEAYRRGFLEMVLRTNGGIITPIRWLSPGLESINVCP